MSDAKRAFLPPEVAAGMFAEDPSSVWLGFHSLWRATGLTEEQFRGELVSGRLVASGQKTPFGYEQLRVKGTDAIAWLVHPDLPADVRKSLKRKGFTAGSVMS